MREALSAALFHFLWQGAALALLPTLALTVRSARVRYAAACAALFAMPVAFAVTFAISLPEAGVRFAAVPVLRAAPEAAFAAGSVAGRFDWAQSMRWFVPFWVAGVAIFYLRTLGSWMAVQRLRRASSSNAPEFWQTRFSELAGRLGIRRAVALLASELVDVPVVAGFLRPAIFVPAALFSGMPVEQLEYLLIHELAHVRRFDYAVNLVQKAVEGLLFYHPAVWWVSRILRTEREHCCDDAVVEARGNAREYAAVLASLEGYRGAPALAASGGDLGGRIRRLLNRPKGFAAGPALGVLAILISGTWAWAALQAPVPPSVPPIPPLPPVSAAPPIPPLPPPAVVPPIPPLPPAQVVPGDLLSITVRDAPELSREYRVLGDGSIRLPLIASPVRVSGLGAEGAAAAVADAIQKGAVISDPQVGVSVLAQADRVKMAPWPVWRKPLPLIQPQAQTNRADRLKQELASPWLKWVNEDVAYIIQDQERAAFLSLGTDEEREHFVEQFWERRDPTPGTPENEFKVEHYRRIAYTNAHFSDAALPGWKTDMGRIYITYGPPDEIDSHRADATPWEQWKYRFIQGVGNNVLVDFRDADHSGRMRMTMDPSRGAVPPAPDLPVVAVRKTADGIVVDLALNPEKSFSVLVRITTPERRPVATLERVVNRESRAELPFALKPGSYRLHVVEKDRSDGSIVDRETDLVI